MNRILITLFFLLWFIPACTDTEPQTHKPVTPAELKNQLVTGNESERLEAFKLLLSLGKEGVRIIEKYCLERTDTGWGEESNGLQCRIFMRETVFDHVPSLKESSDSENEKYYLNITLKNNSNHNIIIKMLGPDTMFEYMNPEITAYTFTGNCARSSWLDYTTTGNNFELKDGEKVSLDWFPFTASTIFKESGPGIYFAQVEIFPTEEDFKSRKGVKSNKICFSVLPSK